MPSWWREGFVWVRPTTASSQALFPEAWLENYPFLLQFNRNVRSTLRRQWNVEMFASQWRNFVKSTSWTIPTRSCFEHVERSFTRTIKIIKTRMDLVKRPFLTFSILQLAFITFNSNLQCQLVKRNWIRFGKLKPKRYVLAFFTN